MQEKPVTFTGSQDLALRLKVEAAKRNLSRSKLIAQICEDWLADHIGQPTLQEVINDTDLSIYVPRYGTDDETAEETATRLRKLLHGNEDDEL